MSKDYEYLSDSELDKLIENVEKEGLVNAPDDFMSEVLNNIEDFSEHQKIASVENHRLANRNILDYSIYCMKVFGSIAAAILIMVMVPFIKGVERIPDKEEVVAQTTVTPREEIVSRRYVRSREEVLNETDKTDGPAFIDDIENWFSSFISK
ncbi:hypothetical protein bpr_I2088 [Butyrivibrio proteoclasticus B316]|uniref:Uncharacterized protein n=1 Tax=Butyrivibrio proteoclasticus (strain ATCC 51982 / DSM 14932 / B316) TaxID=515622 RepID=E0RVH2_BUTPB|nr:hypothetical protein [Butyrivibrio proteoclasticus]ADL34821.1 hypothetical protein bpr_I2088 [Butyrivibrio proteoclasticus B316]